MATENNNKNLNVPNLRFPEFSGEWEKELLGTTCNVLMCKRILASQTNAECGVPFYKIGTIGGIPDAYISKVLFESYRAKYNYPRKGEVMITCAGTVGKAMIFDGEDSYYQDSNIVWIDNPTNKIDNTFLYHFISKVDWSKLNTTTIVRIYNDDLRQLRISYPTLSEQRKISIFLNLLNQRIETQKKIIEDLKKLKDAISVRLFTSATCVKRELSDLATIVMGQSPSSQCYNTDNEGLPLIQGNLDITKGKLTPRIYSSEMTKKCHTGDVILTVRAPVGEVAIADFDACIGRGVCAIRPFNSTYSVLIYQFLQHYKPKWISLEQGSTFTSVSRNDIMSIKIGIPSIQAIEILNILDDKISIEDVILNNLNSQKNYLLTQLFI